MKALLQVFGNRRMAALLALGFASGLPLALTGDALVGWMTVRGVDVKSVSLMGLVALPYSLKVIWSPLFDRYAPPILGRRRGWLLILQLLLIGALAAMSVVDPARSLTSLAALALIVAVFSASQDIVVDAYRVDVLPEDERGAGAAISVMGYRIAMLTSGGLTFILAGRYGLSWPTVYLLMAAAMGIGVVATIFAPEPGQIVSAPSTLAEAVVAPLKEFLLRPGGLLVLAFVLLFKLPDVMTGKMTLRFMLDIGISQDDIGKVRQGLGVFMTIAGALAGGAIVARMRLWPSLWLFGVLQAVSNLGFWILARTGPHYGTMVAVIVVENFCTGLVVAGFTAFLMSQCNPRFSATQMALLTSLMALSRDLGGAPAGYLVSALGWSMFFMVSVLAALPGMALLPWLRPRAELSPAQRFDVLTQPASVGNGLSDAAAREV